MDSASVFTALSSSVLALLISLYVVPLMMRAAVSLNILDRPDQNLKRHREPTPYLGGMGIFLALLFSLALILKLDAFSSAFFLGAAMIVTIGFVDDMKALSPKLKFFLQFLTVFVVIRGGVHITIAILPLWANYLLTFLWLLTIINAFNFLDIMDGLAATVGLASLAPLLLFSAIQGNDSLLCLSSSFFGALLGFLPYNFPRAKIFLGDSGSMLIGYTVGVLCFALDYTAKTNWGLLNPLIILLVPLLELSTTSLRRIALKIPPWRGSPHHLSYFYRDRMGPLATVVFLGTLTLLAGATALLNSLALSRSALLLLGFVLLSAALAALLKRRV